MAGEGHEVAATSTTLATTGLLRSEAVAGAREVSRAGTTWGLFGADDQRGMANFAGEAEVLAAARTVTVGRTVNLDFPMDAFTPGLFPPRDAPRHTLLSAHVNHRDDRLDGFYPQSSSQIDGLRHRRAEGLGFYNGVPDERISAGTPDLGVQVWAERPIVGRGVLVDLEPYLDLDRSTGALAFDITDVQRALDVQGIELVPGDLLLLHTGWAKRYLAMPLEAQRGVRQVGAYPGLRQSVDAVSWILQCKLALAASDTPALEVLPAVEDSPFRESASDDDGMMHQELIAKLGLPLGELWKLDELTANCRVMGRWEFLLIVKPLNLVGGVGSPANAVAVL